MKYQVKVKEIWVRTFEVEANSKAHAKNLVLKNRNNPAAVNLKSKQASYWGVIGPEDWEVIEKQL